MERALRKLLPPDGFGKLDPKRSRMMRGNKGTGTKPEMVVRRAVHRLGYRFRLHRTDLPGKPDLMLRRYHAVIFVHGCFWHRHNCKDGRKLPTTRPAFWRKKFQRNRERDRNARRELRRLGWSVLVVWECETREANELARILLEFLGACR